MKKVILTAFALLAFGVPAAIHSDPLPTSTSSRSRPHAAAPAKAKGVLTDPISMPSAERQRFLAENGWADDTDRVSNYELSIWIAWGMLTMGICMMLATIIIWPFHNAQERAVRVHGS